MTNRIAEARDLLKNSWCRGSYRTDTENGPQFCAIGALGEVGFMGNVINAEQSEEVGVLADVIREQFSDRFINDGDYLKDSLESMDGYEWVIAFNDDIAKSHDEIMAVFDKAALRWDETHAFD